MVSVGRTAAEGPAISRGRVPPRPRPINGTLRLHHLFQLQRSTLAACGSAAGVPRRPAFAGRARRGGAPAGRIVTMAVGAPAPARLYANGYPESDVDLPQGSPTRLGHVLSRMSRRWQWWPDRGEVSDKDRVLEHPEAYPVLHRDMRGALAPHRRGLAIVARGSLISTHALGRTDHDHSRSPQWQALHQGYPDHGLQHPRVSCRWNDRGRDPCGLPLPNPRRYRSVLGFCRGS